MFDALGNEGMADTMGNVQDAMSSISNIGQGFAKGGIVGGIAAAAGEAVNWIGKIAQAHDKKLDKAIEKSKLRAQQLQYIYEQIDGILERFLGSGTELKLVDAENDRTRLNQLNNQIGAIRNKGKDQHLRFDVLQNISRKRKNFKNVFRHTMKVVHTGINVP